MSKMSDEREKELSELCAYISFYATAVMGVPENSPQHPSHFMHPVPGRMSKSQLLSGVRQATNDTIEDAQHFSPERVAAIDNACNERKVLTLSEIRRRYWRKYKKLIEAGHIKNDTEYYLASGLLNDLDSGIDARERHLLQEYVDSYEQSLTAARSTRNSNS